jgi:hypothetical protein
LEAVRFELGTPPSVLFGNFGALYPVYVRGLAYLRMGRGEEAAAEFRKILALPGVMIADPVGALARLGLARATRSRPEYEEFFRLWKDGDAELPVLRAARAEYGALGKE